MSDNWIRASEIAEYVYCGRAWCLRRVRGYASQNVHELKRGASFHQRHGGLLERSIWAKRMAYALLFIVVAIVTFQLLMSLNA